MVFYIRRRFHSEFLLYLLIKFKKKFDVIIKTQEHNIFYIIYFLSLHIAIYVLLK